MKDCSQDVETALGLICCPAKDVGADQQLRN